ncbi:hypothetical protein CYMTET_13082 [Cymbomonas tetramitiformis]|uniref:Kinesin-like protein n=1 Tax=Cymbomonas tetramitiformis TaxID=36881 RepID=A0AAE0GKE7_9CHLO|nr:hypothetical protein CYMTET_13082 [Cymbomonas tetramitiformis]
MPPKPTRPQRSDGNGGALQDGRGSKVMHMRVGVRVRPLNAKESGTTHSIVDLSEGKVVQVLDPDEKMGGRDYLRLDRNKDKVYQFDHAFDPAVSTADIHATMSSQLVAAVMDGYNGSAFAYGPTGSGKTYTMMGTSSQRGLIPLMVHDLFAHAEEHSEDSLFKFKITFIEIYNERVKDLLNQPQEKESHLDVREDANKGTHVSGGGSKAQAALPRCRGALRAKLRFPVAGEGSKGQAALPRYQLAGGRGGGGGAQEPGSGVSSPQELMDNLHRGNLYRTTERTNCNEASSRSHAVLQIVVQATDRFDNQSKMSKLSLIDLAGSERAYKTNARGARQVEGANINKSLLSLANCINALADKTKQVSHIPYRDSKLTRLLKDSLNGKSMTIMLTHVSPAADQFDETLNTLKYANRAKNIKPPQMPERNVVQHGQGHDIDEKVAVLQELKRAISDIAESMHPMAMKKPAGAPTRLAQHQAAGHPTLARVDSLSDVQRVVLDLNKQNPVAAQDPAMKAGFQMLDNMEQEECESISEELLALFHEQQNILKEIMSPAAMRPLGPSITPWPHKTLLPPLLVVPLPRAPKLHGRPVLVVDKAGVGGGRLGSEKSLQIQLTWAQEQGKPAEEVEGLRERAKEEQSCLVALQADLQALRSKIDQVVSAHRLHMLKVLVNQQEARCDAQRFKGQARMKVQLAQQLLQVWDAELPPVFKQLMGGIFDIKPAAGAPTPSKAPAAGDDGETVCTGSPPTISTPPQGDEDFGYDRSRDQPWVTLGQAAVVMNEGALQALQGGPMLVHLRYSIFRVEGLKN